MFRRNYGPTRSFNRRPYNNGPRRFPKRIKTLSSDDPSIFIKKAVENSLVEEPVLHQSFGEFALPQQLLQNIQAKGYTIPTPIQDKTIQPMLDGRDVIGLANTGTGKTAAFLIPIINKIFHNRTSRAIIIAPTRELATQINGEFRSFAVGMNLYSTIVIGGTNMRRQLNDLRRSSHLIIGTPGRMKDVITQKALSLNNFDTVVLDEVDLMMDIGFIQDVKFFISLLPKNRQSLFFSATINTKVNEILQQFVVNPVTVSVKTQAAASNIDQNIIRIISREQKIDQLHQLLVQEEFEKVLIFGRTKHGIEKLVKTLILRGFKVGVIHGNKSQTHRQRTLESFKRNEFKILIASDVASRGLDIPNVSHVINYELPENYDDYIHRIGRTGRADKPGKALTFIE